MKHTQLLLIILFFMQSISANPFSYLKPWTWFRRVDTQERDKRTAELQNMYNIQDEFDTIEKIYKVSSAPLPVEKFADEDYVATLGKNLIGLNTAFITAQQRWIIAPMVYQASSMGLFKQTILNPAIKKAEENAQNAHVTRQDRPANWYAQLKEACSRLPHSEPEKLAEAKKAEFKKWQQEYAKRNSMALERNNYFEEWHQTHKSTKPAVVTVPKIDPRNS